MPNCRIYILGLIGALVASVTFIFLSPFGTFKRIATATATPIPRLPDEWRIVPDSYSTAPPSSALLQPASNLAFFNAQNKLNITQNVTSLITSYAHEWVFIDLKLPSALKVYIQFHQGTRTLQPRAGSAEIANSVQELKDRLSHIEKEVLRTKWDHGNTVRNTNDILRLRHYYHRFIHWSGADEEELVSGHGVTEFHELVADELGISHAVSGAEEWLSKMAKEQQNLVERNHEFFERHKTLEKVLALQEYAASNLANASWHFSTTDPEHDLHRRKYQKMLLELFGCRPDPWDSYFGHCARTLFQPMPEWRGAEVAKAARFVVVMPGGGEATQEWFLKEIELDRPRKQPKR